MYVIFIICKSQFDILHFPVLIYRVTLSELQTTFLDVICNSITNQCFPHISSANNTSRCHLTFITKQCSPMSFYISSANNASNVIRNFILEVWSNRMVGYEANCFLFSSSKKKSVVLSIWTHVIPTKIKGESTLPMTMKLMPKLLAMHLRMVPWEPHGNFLVP